MMAKKVNQEMSERGYSGAGSKMSSRIFDFMASWKTRGEFQENKLPVT
jgi:hypothetical protein